MKTRKERRIKKYTNEPSEADLLKIEKNSKKACT